MILNSLSHRRLRPEVMDQPDLSPASHRAALRGLARINAVSNSSGVFWAEVKRLCERMQRPARLFDIAIGGGDVSIGLWKRAKERGIELCCVGCDRSPIALEVAAARAKAVGCPLELLERDALSGPLPGGFDIILCSLFLHHLSEEDGLKLLAAMAAASEHLVLINDLDRSRIGYLLAYLGSRILTRSAVVHVDAPLSVESAWTAEEALGLARRAGLVDATVSRKWPWRYLLRWERS